MCVYVMLLCVLAYVCVLAYILLHTAVLGNLPDTTTYKSVNTHKRAQTQPPIMVLSIGGSLNFTNTTFMKTKIDELEKQSKVPVRYCKAVRGFGLNVIPIIYFFCKIRKYKFALFYSTLSNDLT